MTLNEFREIIRAKVAESLKKRIEEETQRILNEEKKASDTVRQKVLSTLKNGKYDYAYFAYKLWDCDSDSERDTARSLFSKKLNGTPDADGNIRQFSDDEVTKLYNMLKVN